MDWNVWSTFFPIWWSRFSLLMWGQDASRRYNTTTVKLHHTPRCTIRFLSYLFVCSISDFHEQLESIQTIYFDSQIINLNKLQRDMCMLGLSVYSTHYHLFLCLRGAAYKWIFVYLFALF
jgi:hypothetical protein